MATNYVEGIAISKKLIAFSMMSGCVRPNIMAPIFLEMVQNFEKFVNKTDNTRFAEIKINLQEHYDNIANPQLPVSTWYKIFENIEEIASEIKAICEGRSV